MRAWSDFWQLELCGFWRDFFHDTPKKLQPVYVCPELGNFSPDFPLLSLYLEILEVSSQHPDFLHFPPNGQRLYVQCH